MTDDISGIETVYKPSNSPAGVELEINQVFDNRYLISRRLGAGGMGTAYLATDQLTNEDIVIKVINPNLLDEESKARMIAEGVNARKIKHPNVVAVHDVKEVDGQVYLTMEHVDGQALRNWMAANMASGVNAPIEHVVTIVQQVLEGLTAAHTAGVIHRDLKPENIMLQGTPGEGEIKVKIIDFGIATGLKAAGTTTAAGTIGAPLYMAPEQLTMPDAVRPSADIYSMGRMFYEMLMDVLPDGMWNPPSATRSDVPPALDAVIQKTLQPPKGRYATAKEFSAAISQSMQGGVEPQPIDPELPTPPNDDTTRKQSWRWAYVLGAVVIVGLAVDEYLPDDAGEGDDQGVFFDDYADEADFNRLRDDIRDEDNDSDRNPPPVAPQAATESWRSGDGNVFNMTVENGIVTGSGISQRWGRVSLRGNPNDYVEVWDGQGFNVASLVGGLVPSNSGQGLWDYSGNIMVNGQIVGNFIFHINH